MGLMIDRWTILLEPIEDGWWMATIPEVPGAVSQGETPDEARQMVLDALNELFIARRELAMKKTKAGCRVESAPMSA